MTSEVYLSNLKELAAANDSAQKRLNLICGAEVTTLGNVKKVKHIEDVINLLDGFPDCAGYSNNRRGKEILSLCAEDGVQDMVYFMLKPAIPDLIPETPVSGTTRQYSVEDFRSPMLRMVVETKRIRNKQHGRSVKSELHDDIAEYKNDPYCDDLIFFIYDPDTYIESVSGLVKAIEGEHSHNIRKLKVHCIVQR